MDLHSQNDSSPLLFRVTNLHNSIQMNVGLLEFDAEPNNAFLPEVVMQQLELNDGEEIRIERIFLPKIQSIQLLAPSLEFMKLPYTHVLQDQTFSHWACLSVGDIVPVTFGSQRYILHVTDLEPNASVQLLNVFEDVSVEVVPPLAGLKEQKDADETLSTSTEVTCTVGADQIRQFRYKVDVTEPKLKISFDATQGAPELHVGFQEEEHKYHLGFYRPIERPLTMILPSQSEELKTSAGWLFLTIQTYQADAICTLRIDGYEEDKVKGNKLSPVKASSLCSNCGRSVQNLSLHLLRCSRVSRWHCEQCDVWLEPSEKEDHTHCDVCGKGLPKAFLEQHRYISHQYKCSCGQLMDREKRAEHKSLHCPDRQLSCSFCSIAVPAGDLNSHESTCRNLTYRCTIDGCNKWVRRVHQNEHNLTDHGQLSLGSDHLTVPVASSLDEPRYPTGSPILTHTRKRNSSSEIDGPKQPFSRPHTRALPPSPASSRPNIFEQQPHKRQRTGFSGVRSVYRSESVEEVEGSDHDRNHDRKPQEDIPEDNLNWDDDVEDHGQWGDIIEEDGEWKEINSE